MFPFYNIYSNILFISFSYNIYSNISFISFSYNISLAFGLSAASLCMLAETKHKKFTDEGFDYYHSVNFLKKKFNFYDYP